VGDGSDRTVVLGAATLVDTNAIAAALAGQLGIRDVVLLSGEMGSGKTAFVKAYTAALGVTEPVTSPTFNLVHTYDSGRVPVHHADLYRLDWRGEIDDLGLGELADTGVLLVEWGDPAASEFPEHLHLELATGDRLSPPPAPGRDDDGVGPDTLDERRTIRLAARGAAWAARWEALVDAVQRWRVEP
jgi:tRNA threonylcarbamoyladenosine biosynthesis protein TsaE